MVAAVGFTLVWLLLGMGDRLPDSSTVKAVIVGIVLWLAILAGVLAFALWSREPWRGRFQRMAQGTGVKAWDWLFILVTAWAVWRMASIIEAVPIVLAWLVAAGAGLLVPHLLRPRHRRRRTIVREPDPEDVDDDQFLRVVLSWTLKPMGRDDAGELPVLVSRTRLSDMQKSNPGRKADSRGRLMLEEWVLDGLTDEVERVALGLLTAADDRNLTTYAEICMAVSLAQAIEYVSDLESVGVDDHWRYPIETIAAKVGDCEDTTILASAVLCRMGYPTVLLIGPEHAALGVPVPTGVPGKYFTHEGQRFYYCETTAEGWLVGEVPPSMDPNRISVLARIPAESDLVPALV